MTMAVGQHYSCLNRECGCEVVVTKPSGKASSNPRCCGGSEMKKPYNKPVFRTLEAGVQLLARIQRAGN
jgi:hypothetical protein